MDCVDCELCGCYGISHRKEPMLFIMTPDPRCQIYVGPGCCARTSRLFLQYSTKTQNLGYTQISGVGNRADIFCCNYEQTDRQTDRQKTINSLRTQYIPLLIEMKVYRLLYIAFLEKSAAGLDKFCKQFLQ